MVEGDWSKTYRDQPQCGIQSIQKGPPLFRRRRTVQLSDLFILCHFPLEFHGQSDKNKNEELLQTNAPHVDVNSLHLLRLGSRGTRPAPPDELDDERDEIQRHKPRSQGRRRYREE